MENFIKFLIVSYFFLPILTFNYFTNVIVLSILFVPLSVFGFIVHKYIKDIYITLIVRATVFFFSILTLGAILVNLEKLVITLQGENKYASVMVFLFLAYIIFLFLWFMIEFLFKLLTEVKDPNTVIGKYNRNEAILKLIIAFLTAFLFPNFIFGFNYSLVLTILYDVQINLFESYYLSFIIENALPLSNEVYTSYINNINSNSLLQIHQIAHISISKFLELTVIAFLIKHINGLIKTRKSK